MITSLIPKLTIDSNGPPMYITLFYILPSALNSKTQAELE